jgi:tRNA U55 pseudouridine synthase TruB
VTLAALEQRAERGELGCGELGSCAIPIEAALVDFPPLELSFSQAVKVRNGAIPNEVRIEMVRKFVIGRDRGFSLVSPEGKILALVSNRPDRGFYIQRGFNL